jgi:hypothetical protein
MADASKAIDTLMGVNADVTKALSSSAHPGLARFNAERVIPNKYTKTCQVCSNYADAGTGYAVLSNGRWLTFCAPCADETDEAREARLAAERAEARAIEEAERAERLAAYEAERAARNKALAEEQARRQYVEAFAIDLFDRAGVADQVKPDVHVAIPSATGNNDLDFFRVVRQSRTTTVYRVIGGHNDQRVSLAQAEAALLALVLTEDIPGALATYGQELGRCGVCHRHLTDEESRARGIGPNCAARLGW